LLLARLVEKVSRKFGENRLTSAVFLDVAKAFDTVWLDGLAYKLIIRCHLLTNWNATYTAGGRDTLSSRYQV
jgi:hypothetical protein